MSNGCARKTEKDYLHFLDTAYGSAKEVEYQASLAKRLGYLEENELEEKAAGHFWSGEFREALSVYDALLEMIALQEKQDAETQANLARLEVQRATALRRTGAIAAATATAERAIGLAVEEPAIQAQGYIVLAGLQCDRGLLPLANDAAQRAIDLAAGADLKTQGWAWIVKASSLYLAGKYEEARAAYLEARARAVESQDRKHQTHIEGNIGACWLGLGQIAEARTWMRRAIRWNRATRSDRRRAFPAVTAIDRDVSARISNRGVISSR